MALASEGHVSPQILLIAHLDASVEVVEVQQRVGESFSIPLRCCSMPEVVRRLTSNHVLEPDPVAARVSPPLSPTPRGLPPGV